MGVIYRKEFRLKKRTKMYVRLKDPPKKKKYKYDKYVLKLKLK